MLKNNSYFWGSGVQEFRGAEVQEFRGSEVLEFRGSEVQEYFAPFNSDCLIFSTR